MPDAAPLRADAERNRRRILDAARTVFAQRGIAVGIDVVAREAGVGVGTIYRRFPTKEDLLQAVVVDRVEALRTELDALRAVEDPWDAFAGTVETLAAAIARDRCFFQALQEVRDALPSPDLARDAVREAVAPALERAQAAGAVRDDVVADDVPALCSVAARLPAWRLREDPELWRRYLGVVLDGLRPEGAHPLPRPARDGLPQPA